jgi:hypothetical protein
MPSKKPTRRGLASTATKITTTTDKSGPKVIVDSETLNVPAVRLPDPTLSGIGEAQSTNSFTDLNASVQKKPRGRPKKTGNATKTNTNSTILDDASNSNTANMGPSAVETHSSQNNRRAQDLEDLSTTNPVDASKKKPDPNTVESNDKSTTDGVGVTDTLQTSGVEQEDTTNDDGVSTSKTSKSRKKVGFARLAHQLNEVAYNNNRIGFLCYYDELRGDMMIMATPQLEGVIEPLIGSDFFSFALEATSLLNNSKLRFQQKGQRALNRRPEYDVVQVDWKRVFHTVLPEKLDVALSGLTHVGVPTIRQFTARCYATLWGLGSRGPSIDKEKEAEGEYEDTFVLMPHFLRQHFANM